MTQTRGMVRSMLDMDAELRDPDLAPVRAALSDLLRDLPAADGTTRLLISILVDGERLLCELDVRGGAHVGGVSLA